MSRRKKAEMEAQKLAQIVKDEACKSKSRLPKVGKLFFQFLAASERADGKITEGFAVCIVHAASHQRKLHPEDINDELQEALQPYTVLVIQNFLLETGAVTEIRDYLVGEFKVIEQTEKSQLVTEAGETTIYVFVYRLSRKGM